MLIKITRPAPLGAQSYTYNAANEVATATDGKGQQTSYQYDGEGRVTSITFQDNSSIGYAYDADGNLLSMTDSTGTTSYTFNALNQQTHETLPGNSTLTDTWDGVGNLLSKTDGGGTVSYGYDPANQVTSVVDPSGTITLAYSPDGNPTSETFPSGVTQSMTWNGDQQLTAISATSGASTLDSFAYNYLNPSTNKTGDLRYAMTDGVSGQIGTTTTSYTYDSLNRLTGASGGPSGAYSYAYDHNGNMTSKTASGVQTTMTYNAANELTQAGTTTYTYDADGNETGNSASMSASYNTQNQTTAITPSGGSAVAMSYCKRRSAGGQSAGIKVVQRGRLPRPCA